MLIAIQRFTFQAFTFLQKTGSTRPPHKQLQTNTGRPQLLHYSFCSVQVAYEMARELGFFMFSRQSLLLSGNVTQDGQYPIHQPQPVMQDELRLLLSWMGCLQHDSTFKSF